MRCAVHCFVALCCAVLLATAWPEAVAAHLLCLSRAHVEQPLLSIALVLGIMPPSLFPPACRHGRGPHLLAAHFVRFQTWPGPSLRSCRRGDGPHPSAVPAYPWIHRRGGRLPLLAAGCVATDVRALVAALVKGVLVSMATPVTHSDRRGRALPLARCWLGGSVCSEAWHCSGSATMRWQPNLLLCARPCWPPCSKLQHTISPVVLRFSASNPPYRPGRRRHPRPAGLPGAALRCVTCR